MKYSLNLKYGLGTNMAVPYVIARSSIFSSQIYRGPAERPEATVPLQIAALGDMTVLQTVGRRLDQGDADVFYEILRAFFTKANNQEPTFQVSLERQSLLSNISRSKGGKTNVLLQDSLDRLVNATFCISEKDGRSYTIGILQSYVGCSSSKKIQIQIDPRLIELYMGNQWALLKKQERSALKSPISRALYAYYRTHDNRPYALLPATIKGMVGRLGMQETKWITQLRAALDELQQATGWPVCELATSGDRAGKVVVIKQAAGQLSQHRNTGSMPFRVELYAAAER